LTTQRRLDTIAGVTQPTDDATVRPSAMTERRAAILALVVREHVGNAQPVASSALVRRYDLGCSPATVRAEMAALEEAGLLTHPHTSAGRVPTVAGYRFFVEHLMNRAGLPERARRTIRRQFTRAGFEPERWMRLSAAVMARLSGAAGLVAARPRIAGPLGARRLDLLDLGGGLVQLVAILADGSVRQARWRPARPLGQPDLDRLAALATGRLVAAAGGAGPVPAPPDLGALADELGAIVERLARPDDAQRIYHAGLSQILGAPEFADAGRLREVVEILEHGLGAAARAELPRHGVRVLIGGEPPLEDVPHITLVLARFGQGAEPDGVLGVVGPTRMAYERAVPTVGYVAQLMSGLLAGQPV